MKEIKTFSAVAIRKNLSAFSEKSYTNLWSELSQQLQVQVKISLFEALNLEDDSSIRHQICDAIGEIGGTLLEHTDPNNPSQVSVNLWPELPGQIMGLLSCSNEILIEAGLKILSTLFGYVPETFAKEKESLFNIFKAGMVSSSKNVKLAAVEAFGSYVEIMEPKHTKKFQELIHQLLETVYALLIEDDAVGEDALTVVSDIIDSEPKFFKKYFNELFLAMYKIVFEKKIEDSGVKRMATESLVTYIERLPKSIRDQKDKLKTLLEMIFFHMIDIDQDVDEDWKKPEEGFNEDFEEDPDFEVVRFGMNSIDRLISSVGDQEMLPTLSASVQTMLSQGDWRYQHAALMALSQVGEYIEEIDEIKPIMQVVMNYISNINPKLRYAVCHCIGQISDDMQPKFQEVFSDSILPTLIQTLYDPIPRVQSHAAAAITNFVEGMEREALKNYLTPIMEKCFELAQTGISICKENAISAIAATAEAAGDLFKPFFPNAVPVLFELLKKHTTKEYRQLKGQIIECLTLMAHAVGKEMFAPYAPTLIEIMVNIQESKLEDVDPQKSYLLSGWQRLCITMGPDFASYLPRVLPSLFKLLENIFSEKETSAETPESEEKKEDINTYETEECEVALNMLTVLIDEMKENFSPFVESAIKLILPLCNYNKNDSIRSAASKCLPSLVSCIKNEQPQQVQTVVKWFLAELWKSASSEYDANVIVDQVGAMKECIEEVNNRFLAKEELDEISQNLIKLLVESDKRKLENEKYKSEGDVDEEEVELLDEENSTEEDLQIAVAELIGSLFKTHKEMTLPLVELLYNEVLAKVLQPTLSEKMHKFGLFLIDDMIEHLGIELIPDKWPTLLEALIRYSTDKSCTVRQAAVYGIGILAEKSKEVFAKVGPQCIETLYESLKLPGDNEKAKVYGHCKDNTVSAIGKIIKSHYETLAKGPEVIQLWLSNLPLKFDKPEAKLQHDLLADIMLNNPNLLIGTNLANLKHIFKIFADIVDNQKICTAETKNKIKTCLGGLKNNPMVQSQWGEIAADLNETQKKKLEECMQN